MVRISSTFTSKLALATSITLLAVLPFMLLMWFSNIPSPWQLLGAESFFEPTSDDLGKYSSLGVQYLFYFVLIWPIAFAYAFYSIPSRLTISEDGLVVKNFGKEHRYGFDEVGGIAFKQGQNSETFLRLKLKRRWYTFEIALGQVREINKYLPTYLNDAPKLSK